MTPPKPEGRRGLGWMDLARGLFLVLALGFGWWSIRSRRAELLDALSSVSLWRCVLAALLVLVGLAITGVVWRELLASWGRRVPAAPAASTFFVGQLGKYIPGSVWSLGAQADMARSFGIAARTTVAAGLLFLWVHVVTAVGVTAALGVHAAGSWNNPGLRLVAGVLALIGMTPLVLGWLGQRLSGSAQPPVIRWRLVAALIGMMAVVWALYGTATALVVPPATLTEAGGIGSMLGMFAVAFAASYVIGVVIILAPAGVGAREAALIALLSPALGVTAATATALVIRVIHTVCDFAIAGMAWSYARATRPPQTQTAQDDQTEPV